MSSNCENSIKLCDGSYHNTARAYQNTVVCRVEVCEGTNLRLKMARAVLLLVIMGMAPFKMALACDVNAANQCTSDVDLSSTINLETIQRDVLDQHCRDLNDAKDCLAIQIAKCSGDPSASTLQASLNQIMERYIEFCNDEAGCVVDMNRECADNSAIDLNNMPDKNDITPSFCQEMMRVDECTRNPEKVEPFCMAMVSVQSLLRVAPQFLLYECQTVQCDGVQACLATFKAGRPSDFGFDANTCTLFKDYAGCVVGAKCNETSVSMPDGTPSSSAELSTSILNACSLINTEASIWDCIGFTTCVTDYRNVTDIMRPDNICPAIQNVLGCAARHAASCPSVSNSVSFKQQAFQLMIDLAAKGCGQPDIGIYTEECTVTTSCPDMFANFTNFDDLCTAIMEFQECAGSAAPLCNLQPSSSAVNTPTLSGLAPITMQLCNELRGQSVSTCNGFMKCAYDDMVPLTDGGLFDPNNWCDIGITIIERALAHKTCGQVSDSMAANLKGIRKRYTDEGEGKCKDRFYHTSSDAAETAAMKKITMIMLMLFIIIFLN